MNRRSAALSALLVLGVASCASSGVGPSGPAGDRSRGAEVTTSTGAPPALAGARCSGDRCRCRTPGADDREKAPPASEAKRFEIRIWADGGKAVLSTDLGVFAGAGPEPACYYVDVAPGSKHEVTFVANESQKGGGVAPGLSIAEYGPTKPVGVPEGTPPPAYWYDILKVSCVGENGRCDRFAAEDWAKSAQQRRRGRLDPCGSTVISHLAWETTGGVGDREGGYFRDFTVKFGMEVKHFPTQYAPGSTQCVPK